MRREAIEKLLDEYRAKRDICLKESRTATSIDIGRAYKIRIYGEMVEDLQSILEEGADE